MDTSATGAALETDPRLAQGSANQTDPSRSYRREDPLNLADDEKLRATFTYRGDCSAVQIARMQAMRRAALEFAREIVACCPRCPDRTAALRFVQQATMTANASVVLDGLTLP